MAKQFSHKTNTIKWLGILTMTIDHVGYYLFPEMTWLRIIGRLAFPCFLYAIIEGTERTSNYPRYIFQLFLLGVISMPITPATFNVLFLLSFFSLSLKFPKYFLVFLALSFFVEYSIYGFLFGWALWWMKNRDTKEGIIGSLLVQLLNLSPVQIFSVLSIPILKSEKGIRLPRVPKYVFYLYYPIHQAVLIWVAS